MFERQPKLIVLTVILFIGVLCEVVNTSSENWVVENVAEIKRRLANLGIVDDAVLPRVKNVILFVGDGMGISTLTAARLYKGQQPGGHGESEKLAWDEFLALAHIRVRITTALLFYLQPTLALIS